MKENKKIEAITIQDNEPFLRQISSSVDIKNDKEAWQYIVNTYYNHFGNITEYIRTVTQTEGINTVDIMFLNGLDPISSIESMNRLNSLMQ